ncbi:MAG: asparagine--tRNA ligase [Bacilli bacterium]|nr:asparagine--tRNA ligase [Bacilli bacterium]MDD4808425.1 asparagine--tRNA ligase [Bacilli bacterium]
MPKILELKTVLNNYKEYLEQEVTLAGWVRNHRKQKNIAFIDFYDGSIFDSVQIVYNETHPNFEELNKIHIGSSIKVTGKLIKSFGSEQDYEVEATEITLLGDCPEDYPIQPQRYPREYLREQAYLRPRTKLFQAIFRIRNITTMAIHSYFQNEGYIYTHTPLITSNDGEGAGEMFRVTTLDLNKIPLTDKKEIDYQEDFFSKKVGLTVTGQLQAEAFALAYRKVYTFGPTFRAEKSNTKIHAAEFWMIEPEIAFCDLNDLLKIQEEFLKYVIDYVLVNAPKEMEFLDKFVEKGLIERLKTIVKDKFNQVTYKEAIEILKKANLEFEFKPEYGEDIAKEHEKYLTETYFKTPVFITNWPKEIKAFYMKLDDNNETVAAVDLIVAKAGELMGGSQREEDYHKLVQRMEELDIKEEGMEWYLNLRKYGGCIHSGFGLGFERLLIFLTGMDNIRDVIPFARTYGNCDF